MIVFDKVYGEFEVNEPVLIDLLNSKTLNRLNGISMAGFYPAYPQISSDDMSRYYHSIGVFLLLRKYGASLEEQIAGLIHDVSHTAFSHTIDYIKENMEEQKNQSGQDDIHENFVKNSDIAEILKNHDIDVDYILEDKHFTLKENNVPDICADRIDYSLRQGFVLYNVIDEKEKNRILDSLINNNGTFMFKDFETAKFFAEFFWKMDDMEWSGMKSAIMFAISGKLFQRAIEMQYVTFDDFYNFNDKVIIEKIKNNLDSDPVLKKYFEYLNLPVEKYKNDKENHIRQVFCKVRKIDPQFISDNGKLLRVSDIDLEFRNKIKNKNRFNEYFIKLSE